MVFIALCIICIQTARHQKKSRFVYNDKFNVQCNNKPMGYKVQLLTAEPRLMGACLYASQNECPFAFLHSQCNFLLLIDVNVWINNDCVECVLPSPSPKHLWLHGWLVHIGQKEKIATEIAVKFASVNKPWERSADELFTSSSFLPFLGHTAINRVNLISRHSRRTDTMWNDTKWYKQCRTH
jgi:hypothetical protein